MLAAPTLHDCALIRLIPLDPPLDAQDFATLAGAIDKLFAHFLHEGRCQGWALERLAHGSLLVLAYEAQEPLSGCSQDKLAHLFAVFAQRLGRPLLEAPGILIDVEGITRCCNRTQVRELVAQGLVTAASPCFDLSGEDLGAFRRSGRTQVGACWLRRFVEAPNVPTPQG